MFPIWKNKNTFPTGRCQKGLKAREYESPNYSTPPLWASQIKIKHLDRQVGCEPVNNIVPRLWASKAVMDFQHVYHKCLWAEETEREREDIYTYVLQNLIKSVLALKYIYLNVRKNACLAEWFVCVGIFYWLGHTVYIEGLLLPGALAAVGVGRDLAVTAFRFRLVPGVPQSSELVLVLLPVLGRKGRLLGQVQLLPRGLLHEALAGLAGHVLRLGLLGAAQQGGAEPQTGHRQVLHVAVVGQRRQEEQEEEQEEEEEGGAVVVLQVLCRWVAGGLWAGLAGAGGEEPGHELGRGAADGVGGRG